MNDMQQTTSTPATLLLQDSQNHVNFWTTACNDFRDIDSSTQSSERDEFIYPNNCTAKNGVIGVAIKRNLKISDDMDFVDSVLDYPPMANMDELILDDGNCDVDGIVEANNANVTTVKRRQFSPLAKDIFLRKLEQTKCLLANIDERISEKNFKNTIQLLYASSENGSNVQNADIVFSEISPSDDDDDVIYGKSVTFARMPGESEHFKNELENAISENGHCCQVINEHLLLESELSADSVSQESVDNLLRSIENIFSKIGENEAHCVSVEKGELCIFGNIFLIYSNFWFFLWFTFLFMYRMVNYTQGQISTFLFIFGNFHKHK